MKKDVWTVQEIRQQAQSLVGKTIKEIQSSYAISSKVKGSIGQIIEDGAFSYSPNSNKGPDFEEAGVELKVTPFVRLKNGQCSAKERLVLNIINYIEEVRYEFETSSFWTKNKSIEIIFYEYQKELHPEDYRIEFEHLHEFSTKDLLIIRADWETIVNKIRDGLAHELSEGDTLYLGACTKGANRQSLRQQPYSDVPAMQRAFSLKTTYMTKLLRNEVCRKGIEKEELIKESELLNKRFEDIIRDKILAFKNRSVKELMTIYGVQSDSKSNLVLLTGKLLGIEGRINNTEEFQKANIEIKTIRLNLKNKIKESMSFPTFKYEDIVQEEWETSTLRQRFEETKYLFVVFKEQLNGDYVIADAMFWNMKPSDLDGDVQSVWQDTKNKIMSGQVYKSVGRTYHYQFLPKSQTSIIHVRPHGKNRNDTNPLPTIDLLTGKEEAVKMCFFVNNDYILKQLTLNKPKPLS
jgi:DNA mismatch repair protein MutH